MLNATPFPVVRLDCSLPDVTYSLVGVKSKRDTPAAADNAAIRSRILPPAGVSRSEAVEIEEGFSNVLGSFSREVKAEALDIFPFNKNLEEKAVCFSFSDEGGTGALCFQGDVSSWNRGFERKAVAAIKCGFSWVKNSSAECFVLVSSCMQPAK